MVRSTLWLTIALAFRSLGQAGLLVVFARFGSPETLGNYSLALAITAPIFVLCEFGLRTVYLTHRGDHPFRSYLNVRLVTLTVAVALTAGIGLIFVPTIVTILLLVSLMRAADSMGELYSAPLQRHDSIPTVLVAYGTNALLTIGVGIAVLVLTNDLQLVIASLIVVSTATTLFMMKRPTDKLLAQNYPMHDKVSRNSREDHKSVIKAGLPTGVSWGLLSLLSSVPQYFIAIYFTQVEVGYFAIILYVVVVAEIFLNAASQSWIPAAKKMHSESVSFAKSVFKTASIWTTWFIPVSAIACVAAYFMLPIIFGETYAVQWQEILPLFCALVTLPMVFFSAMALNVANNYVKALATSIAAVVVALIAALILVPIYGVAGGLWVSFAALASRAVFGFITLSWPSTGHANAPHKNTKTSSSTDF